MRLLLDTHALIWWLGDEPALSSAARVAIDEPGNVVAVSAVTAWEMAIKRAIGRLDVPDDLVEQMAINGFIPLPITVEDGLAAGGLPGHHDDPFDRMLIAQAQAGGWTIVTRDRRFAAYEVALLPA